MRVFRHFLTIIQAVLPMLLLGLVLYGFPSCWGDDSGTNVVELPCEEIIEEEGMIFQEQLDDYHYWIFRVQKSGYDLVWGITHPQALPPWNLPESYQKDSLRVRIKGVRIPESQEWAIDIKPWPLLILEIEELQ